LVAFFLVAFLTTFFAFLVVFFFAVAIANLRV
jgi:hypothetical protein